MKDLEERKRDIVSTLEDFNNVLSVMTFKTINNIKLCSTREEFVLALAEAIVEGDAVSKKIVEMQKYNR